MKFSVSLFMKYQHTNPCVPQTFISEENSKRRHNQSSWIPEGLLLGKGNTHTVYCFESSSYNPDIGVSKRKISGHHKRTCLITGVMSALEFTVQLPGQLSRDSQKCWDRHSFAVYLGKARLNHLNRLPFSTLCAGVLNIMHLMCTDSRERAMLRSRWMLPSHLTPHIYAKQNGKSHICVMAFSILKWV